MAAPINYENPSPGWSAAGVEPPPEFKASGYVAGYKPPAGFFNWFWTLVSKCIGELQNALKTYSAENETDKAGISAALSAHTGNKANPHGVTKAQVGLGSAENTADSAKAVYSATRLATARTINGVAFDGTGNINVNASPGAFTVQSNNAGGGTVGFGEGAAGGKIVFSSAQATCYANGGYLFRNKADTAYLSLSALSFQQQSSRKVKENIRPLDGEIDALLQLAPVSFDYKEGFAGGNRHRLGLIAEDTAALFPTAVAQTDPDDSSTMGISYTEFVAPLIALCQRQQREIDEMKAAMREHGLL